MPLFLIRRRDNYSSRCLRRETETTGARVWAWLDPAVMKSGYGSRRPTAETQFHIAAFSFCQHLIRHMLCSSLSLLTHIPPVIHIQTQCLHKERVRFHCSLLLIGQNRQFLGLREASRHKRSLWGEAARHCSCGPWCYRTVHLLHTLLPRNSICHFTPPLLLYFTPGSVQ